MGLSADLISKFVKITNDSNQDSKETTVYGTVKIDGKNRSVTLDGSNTQIPISEKSTASIANGDRVTVLIKNHTAIVTGNLKDPSGSSASVEGMAQTVSGFDQRIVDCEKVVAKAITTDTLNAEIVKAKAAIIDEIDAEIIEVERGRIDALESDTVKTKDLEANYAKIHDLDVTNEKVNNLDATVAEFKDATAEKLTAHDAIVESLNTTYANIDFSNIGKAAMEYFYANSGLIENVTVENGTITGHLVGVTISGDVLEGNTVIADKLVIKGEDGLYYKLNVDGETVAAEQTDHNSLNGQIIKAKSITADRISVSDLIAFDATIGGFRLTENSIYSEVKDSAGNTTRGIYMDTDGQFNFGDETNFVKYYKDADGNYRLAISAESIMYALNGKQYSIADLGVIGEYVHIGVYEGEPCIILGESDSDFQLIITNTRISFMESNATPAYINNQSLHIKKAVIEEELQQGQFVWRVRSNGNMGLVWIAAPGDDFEEPDDSGDDSGDTGGDSGVTYLFKDEWLACDTWNNSLPALEYGNTYYAVVNGEELAPVTFTAGTGAYFTFPADHELYANWGCVIYEATEGWMLHPMDSPYGSALVSVYTK